MSLLFQSEDINNLSYALILKGALINVVVPSMNNITQKLRDMARRV